jgi:hypothetical protein
MFDFLEPALREHGYADGSVSRHDAGVKTARDAVTS